MDNKHDNFKRVAENRINKIINLISLLGNLDNTSFYEYSNEELEAVFSAIQSEPQSELDKQHEKLIKKNAEKKRFEL